jgi:histidinol-phosphatase (PHP family)
MIDTHTHMAPYSFDARQSVGQLLAQAERQGLAGVCTTDHYEKDLFYTGGREDIFDLAEFHQAMEPQRNAQPAGKPRLFLGIELGWLPHLDAHLAEISRAWPFDGIILSLHILKGEDPYTDKKIFRPGKIAVYAAWLREMTAMIHAVPDFDILGHYDYVSRYGPYPDRKMRYAEVPEDFDAFLGTLAAAGKALEINTRTAAKLQASGYAGDEAWPDPAIIRRYRELGGQLISLGSDAHLPGETGNLFPEAAAWLRRQGCSELVHFERRRVCRTAI